MQTIEIVKTWITKLPNINIIFSEELPTNSINKKESMNLMFYKNKIDNVNNHKIWDKAKKLSNEYELIHLPSKKLKTESIALYDPLSRSYFKLWEIIFDFQLFNNPVINQKSNIIAGLAEGPGGFIEALLNYRKKYHKLTDKIYGITLRSSNKDIPGWNKATEFIKKNTNINILYGKDNTGNIYNLDNILDFQSKVGKNSAYIVTADGGFDFSIDFNNQEQLSYRIIFCEIVTCLSIQQKGGHFICKVFDLYTPLSLKLIYLLTCLYDTIYLTKPLTSRPANSEKYIICKNFKGISKEYLDKLLNIVTSWEIINNIGMYIHDLFDIELPQSFVNIILEYNKHNSNTQIENIEKTLTIIKNQSNLTTLNTYIKFQSQQALNWCTKFDVEINYNSNFFKNC